MEKGTVPICRNGPKGAAHKWGLSPFPSNGLPVAGVVLNNPAAPSAVDASLPLNRRELASPIAGDQCLPKLAGMPTISTWRSTGSRSRDKASWGNVPTYFNLYSARARMILTRSASEVRKRFPRLRSG